MGVQPLGLFGPALHSQAGEFSVNVQLQRALQLVAGLFEVDDILEERIDLRLRKAGLDSCEVRASH